MKPAGADRVRELNEDMGNIERQWTESNPSTQIEEEDPGAPLNQGLPRPGQGAVGCPQRPDFPNNCSGALVVPHDHNFLFA
jgi:hypothetical protein